MPDPRTFPPLVDLIERHVRELLADRPSSIWEHPYHPEGGQGREEAILNRLIEGGIITMGRHQIPCNIPTFHISRGHRFNEWKEGAR